MQSYVQFSHLQAANVPLSYGPHRRWWATTLATCMKALIIFALMLVSKYLSTWLRFTYDSRRMQQCRVPATFPYLFPILRSSVDMVWNPLHFIRSATFYDGRQGPVRVKVLGSEIFLVQGRENIVSLFKQPTGTFLHHFVLKNMFGMHSKSLSAYKADDSGHHYERYPGSMTEPHNRIDFLTHEMFAKFLSGPSLSRMFERFSQGLLDRLEAVDVGADWKEIPDLLEFIQMEVSAAILEAITGPQLLAQNPTFVSDLFKYDSAVPTLSKGVPRCIAPEAYRIRDKMLHMIKKWHAYARKHFDDNLIGADGDFDPFWGSEHMRYRQKTLLNVDGFDEDALASSDLGLIWATLTNAVPCTFWAVIHVCRDPTLLPEIRDELLSSTRVGSPFPKSAAGSRLDLINRDSPSGPELLVTPTSLLTHTVFDIDLLLRQPLLQSVYSETLRLYVRVFITRCPDRSDLRINDWLFPKNKVILVSTDPAHLDSTVWNTAEGLYPLTTFWPKRFLVREGVYKENPARKTAVLHNDESLLASHERKLEKTCSSPQTSEIDTKMPRKFTLNGLNGSWIPFGGGSRACPGRHFAKREILIAVAMILTAFDIEPLGDEKVLQMRSGRYGLGAQYPVGKVPVRMRRAQ